MEIIDLDVDGSYLEAAMEIWNAVVLEECAKMNAIASLLSNNEIDSNAAGSIR